MGRVQRKKVAEVDVAAPIVAWLESEYHADVYQEVAMRGGVADIVAILPRPERVWIIETKTSLNLSVLNQAFDRMPMAHYVSVGTQYTGRCAPFTQRILHDYGIGWISVNFGYGSEVTVREQVEAHLNRKVMGPNLAKIRSMRKKLCPEMKQWAQAGTSGGGHWTPFRSTSNKVLRIVRDTPGITIKELVDEHGRFHYHTAKSARQCLVDCILRGIVDGVAVRREGKAIRLYPSEHPVLKQCDDVVMKDFEEALRCLT